MIRILLPNLSVATTVINKEVHDSSRQDINTNFDDNKHGDKNDHDEDYDTVNYHRIKNSNNNNDNIAFDDNSKNKKYPKRHHNEESNMKKMERTKQLARKLNAHKHTYIYKHKYASHQFHIFYHSQL